MRSVADRAAHPNDRFPLRAESSLPDLRAAKAWMGLAVLSLILSGLLSLILVVGRLPGLHQLFSDPLFFKRGLVVHVNLALVVWFYAFFVGLYCLIPARTSWSSWPRIAAAVAFSGVVLLVAAAGIPGAMPVLSNYLPMVDHPLFAVGLVVFGVGVLAAIFGGRLLPGREREDGDFYVPPAARVALRAGAIALFAAALTFAASYLATPRDLPVETYYELMLWGGGHVLQFASVAGMLAAWLILLERVLGHSPLGRTPAVLLFAIFTLPLLAAPLLALGGTHDMRYHGGFTTLMRWGIFPVVLIVLGRCLYALVGAHRRARDLGRRSPFRHPMTWAFLASAAMTVLGFVLGASIRGSNTMVPAHYHASIGAVTVAFMGVTYLLLERMGMLSSDRQHSRSVTLQPVIFGVGQVVFAVGFAFAGAHGMARKSYGAEQHVNTIDESVGLIVMGVGGLVAVIGGLLYLWVVVRAWIARPHLSTVAKGELGWTARSIHSRS